MSNTGAISAFSPDRLNPDTHLAIVKQTGALTLNSISICITCMMCPQGHIYTKGLYKTAD